MAKEFDIVHLRISPNDKGVPTMIDSEKLEALEAIAISADAFIDAYEKLLDALAKVKKDT